MTVVDYEAVLYGTECDDMIHVACPCSPAHSLCGTMCDGDDELLDEEVDADCVVCLDLESFPCPRCGK